MGKRLLLGLGISLGLLLPGCHVVKPEVSVEGVPEACCTTADFQLTHFKGCRLPQRNCSARKGEKFWMTGNVSCGAVDEAQCEGGRCCEYRPIYDPSIGRPEGWMPPGTVPPVDSTPPVATPPVATPPAAATPPVSEEPPMSEPPTSEAAPEVAG